MGLFSFWDLILPGSTAAVSGIESATGGDESDRDAALGLTGDSATDRDIINSEYGPGKTWPQLNRDDYLIPPSTGPENRPGVTARAEDAWRIGAQEMPGRAAPGLAGVDRGFEMASGARQRNAQDTALGGVGSTGLLADQMSRDRGLYWNAAQGRVPSAAEQQQQLGLAQAIRQQLALASTNRSPGGAYQAQAGAGALQRQGIADAAVLRAQEQAEARNALVARDTAEANVRNAMVNQALGVSAGESQAYSNALGLNAQELQRQQWGAGNQLAQTGLNDQSMLGMMGLSNEFYGTGNEMERTRNTYDISAADLRARYQEAQADQFQRWLAQWVAYKTAEKNRQSQERAALIGGGGAGFGTILQLLG